LQVDERRKTPEADQSLEDVESGEPREALEAAESLEDVEIGERGDALNRDETKVSSNSNIVIFTCGWYPAIAADNAGVVGEEYPTDARIVTMTCAGRLSPALILDAFGSGAQGVLVAACKPELCHYVNGSSTCEQVVAETRELAELLGISSERIHLEAFDTEEGKRFADCVNGFYKKIVELGVIAVEQQ